MFTDNLVESRNIRLEGRRIAVLPLVAGVHAALAAALVLASVWSLRYIMEPPIIYISNIPVKLMPPPGPGPKQEAQAPEIKHPPSATNQIPWDIPETPPVIYPSEQGSEGPTGIGVEGAVEGGGWGDDAGDSTMMPGIPSIPRPPVPETGPLQIGGDVKAPVRLTPLTPKYTASAINIRVQGVVVLRLTIDKEGRVTNVQVVSGLPFGLTQAAEEAAWRLQFRPAYRASTGKPVECYFDLKVEFKIN